MEKLGPSLEKRVKFTNQSCCESKPNPKKKKCCVRDAVTEIKAAMEENAFATWNSDGRERFPLRRSIEILENTL